MKYRLSPSFLSLDFLKAGECIKECDDGGADWMHVDVMDGFFVPSISFGMPVIKSLRQATGKPFDVHLMIEKPERYIEEFTAVGANIITVHQEAVTHLDRCIHQIRKAGAMPGVALNPATCVKTLEYILGEVDLVLVMSVNPGFGGQKFIPYAIEKIKELHEIRRKKNLSFDIEVDGGVTKENVRDILDAGANVIVAGSSVFKGNIKTNCKYFKEILDEYENREG